MLSKIKQYFLFFGFLGFFLGLGFLSFFGAFDHYGSVKLSSSKSQSSPEDSFFKTVEFYFLNHGVPEINMQGREFTVSEDFNNIFAEDLSGFYYSNSGKDPVKFRSLTGKMIADKKNIELIKDVFVEDDKYQITSDRLNMEDNGRKMLSSGNVKTKTQMITNNNGIADATNVNVRADKLQYLADKNFVQYDGHVEGELKRQKVYEEGLNFKTDKLTVDTASSIVNLSGSVYLTKGKYEAWSNTGEIFLENYNKKLKYYALSDDVRMREEFVKNGKKIERKAFAEKLEGWMNERKVVLTGFPKVIQDKDVIKGNRIILRENSESVEIDDANSSLILK